MPYTDVTGFLSAAAAVAVNICLSLPCSTTAQGPLLGSVSGLSNVWILLLLLPVHAPGTPSSQLHAL